MKQKKGWPPEREQRLRELVSAVPSMRWSDIAKEFGVCFSSIQKVCERRGIKKIRAPYPLNIKRPRKGR